MMLGSRGKAGTFEAWVRFPSPDPPSSALNAAILYRLVKLSAETIASRMSRSLKSFVADCS